MNILHTSDWHLGQTLFGRKRHDEFQRFLDWLRQTIIDEHVDVLLVSGDVFDSGLPSNHAQTLYYRFLRDVSAGPCRHIVITAGNHDSPSFLDAPQSLLSAMDIHVTGRAREPEEEVLLLRDAEGRPQLIVCAVPFLRDRDLFRASPGDSVDERDRLLAEGLRDHYLRCAEEAERLRGGADIPIIAMGHLFTTGGLTLDGDGVRDLRIGSLGQIGADVFPSTFDYVALGHLHVPQTVRGQERIRYCGSPLPMGFGEARQQKQVCLVQSEGRELTVRPLSVPLFQKLEQVRGDREHIEARLDELEAQGEPVWVEVRHAGEGLASDLRDRLMQKKLEFVNILAVRRERTAEASLAPEHEMETLEELDADDVFERRLADMKEAGHASEAQLQDLRDTYREALRTFLQLDEGEGPCAS
jgi:exonuclease SbcD